MYKTYLNLCQRLIEEAGISGTIASVDNQTGEFKRVVEWVQRACFEIEGTWTNWNFLHTFSTIDAIVGVSDYPAPADHNVWDITTAIIKDQSQHVDFIQWIHQKLDPTELVSGDIYKFTVLPDQSVRVYDTPTTATTINIEYWKVATQLESNTDEPAIPLQYRDIIVWKALQYYAYYESADEVKTQAETSFGARWLQLESRELPGYQGSGAKYGNVAIDVVAQPSEFYASDTFGY